MNKWVKLHKHNFILVFFISLFTIISRNILLNSSIHFKGAHGVKEIISAAFNPDLSINTLVIAFDALITTLIYATTGISIALILGFILSLICANIITKKRLYSKLTSTCLALMRGIHPLIYGVLFISMIGINAYAGILAIGISYGGAIGRVYSNHFLNCPQNTIKLIEHSHKSSLVKLFYGYLPIVITDLYEYFIYRFECAIRTSIIMSFIGLGGLGYEISLSLNDLYYNQMWTYIYVLIALILIVESFSKTLKKGFYYEEI